jgi:hypothetical protein
MLGTKIIPIGPSCAIDCASWPAPLGRRADARPSAEDARSIADCTSGVATAGGLRLTRRISICVRVAEAMSAARARIRSPRSASLSVDKSRSSITSFAKPGTTFGAFGAISI